MIEDKDLGEIIPFKNKDVQQIGNDQGYPNWFLPSYS